MLDSFFHNIIYNTWDFEQALRNFWEYASSTWALKFLESWCKQVMRSRLKPMKKVAKTIRAHKALILNWVKAKNEISLGAVEGQNNKAKVVIRKSYGFKTVNILQISLYHKLGKLPVPDLAHRYFWRAKKSSTMLIVCSSPKVGQPYFRTAHFFIQYTFPKKINNLISP